MSDPTQPPPFNVHNARTTSVSPASLTERRVIVEQVTLRDQFAMAALTGIADQLPYSIDNRKELVRNLAIGAYQIADAMLEARSKTND